MKSRQYLFIILVSLLISSMAAVAAADTETGEDRGINSFTLSPSQTAPGENVLVSINANMTAGADATTYYCLYFPTPASGIVAAFPPTIDLDYYDGFDQYTVVSQLTTPQLPACPARNGQTSGLYEMASVPVGDTAYDGSFSLTISPTAAAGTYSWTLLLQESTAGGPNILSTSHTIAAPLAVQLQQSDAVADGGFSGSLIAIIVVLGLATLFTTHYSLRRLKTVTH